MPDVGYQLTIGGSAAPQHVLEAIRRLEVEEHASMASIMRLTLAVAVDASGDGWTIIDDDLFPRLAEMTLSITIGSAAAEPVLTAYVIETRTVLSEEPGESILDVVAIDASVLLDLEEKVRAWPNTADSDIAEAIFGEHGLRAVVDRAEPTRDESDVVPIQHGTDMQLLVALAERHGFEVYVTTTDAGVEGHFHPPRLDEPSQDVLTVGFGAAGNVPEVTVTHDALRPTTARLAQIAERSLQTESGNADTVSLPDLGGTSVLTGADTRTVLLSRTGIGTTAELQTTAQAVVDRSSWAIRAEGEVSTMRLGSVLRARQTVALRGVGRTHSGTYYVERVLHVFDEDGHTQRFALLRNATGLSGREDFADDGA